MASSSLITDAKQRVILSMPRKDSTQRIVCAEPSPDVAQAISEALKIGFSVDLAKASGADASNNKTVGLDFGRSSAASVAQLGERLAVVQLLRDRMYRACEAYANGAIGEAAYTLLMARNDKTMMSLLSNELAAGAFGRALATAGGSASLSGVSAKQLAEQQTAVKKAADSLAKVATSDGPKKEDLEKASSALDQEVAKLVSLERSINASSTAAPAMGVGGQSPADKSTDSQRMGEIHRNYLDDDGVDPLVDACIIGVEKLSLDAGAKANTRAIADRAQQARNKATEYGTLIAARRAQLAEIEANRAAEQQRLVDIQTGKARARDDKEAPALRMQLATYEARVMAVRDEIAALREERDLALRTPELEAKDLYLATQSPFAAFCFQSVLAGDSKFLALRMQQKRQLRGIDFDRDLLTSKQLEMCTTVAKAEKGALEDKARTTVLTECAELMRRLGQK